MPACFQGRRDRNSSAKSVIALRCLAFLLVIAAATLIPGPTRAGASQEASTRSPASATA